MITWTFLPLVTSLLVACDNTPPIIYSTYGGPMGVRRT